MSNPILEAIAKEQQKLIRQESARDATQALIDVLGKEPREVNKLARQEDSIKETKTRIAKLNKAVK